MEPTDTRTARIDPRYIADYAPNGSGGWQSAAVASAAATAGTAGGSVAAGGAAAGGGGGAVTPVKGIGAGQAPSTFAAGTGGRFDCSKDDRMARLPETTGTGESVAGEAVAGARWLDFRNLTRQQQFLERHNA